MSAKRMHMVMLVRQILLRGRSSRRLSLLSKWMLRWRRSEVAKRTSRLAVFWTFLAGLTLGSSGSFAGGAMSGGASEVTQILNNVELTLSFLQQIQSYENQLQQYSTMMQNLQANPGGVSLSTLRQLSNNSARLMGVGQDIASTMSRVDQNFANTFKSPQAQTFATKFKLWTNSSQDGLRASMLNAGLQREQFGSDTAALDALTNKVANSQGNLAALQALGNLNAQQIQESMKLRDLISQQQVAENTYLAAQAAKDQSRQDAGNVLAAPFTDAPPMTGSSRALDEFKWNKAH